MYLGLAKSEFSPVSIWYCSDALCFSRNPIRAAYIASLESQISSLRDELATVYKTQGQNAQRLLAMNETLREKEEISRLDSESLRKSRDEIAALRKKVDQHNELMIEKDRTAQVRTLYWTVMLCSDQPFARSSTTRSAPYSWSSLRSRSGMRFSRRTMRSFFNAGWTQSKPKSTK